MGHHTQSSVSPDSGSESNRSDDAAGTAETGGRTTSKGKGKSGGKENSKMNQKGQRKAVSKSLAGKKKCSEMKTRKK